MPDHQEQNSAIRDQFAKQAEGYAQLARGMKNPKLAPLIDGLDLTPNDHLLDVGCGTGRLTLALAEIAAQVTGIDLTPEMLEQAKAQQAQEKITNVTFQQGDALPLPFADASFDKIVTQATFHHFADPSAVLAEMKRVCKPGGRIAVIDLTPDPAKSEAFDYIEKLRDPSHVHAHPAEEIRAYGRNVGLVELLVDPRSSALPIEAVLATSFPGKEALKQVRALYSEDATSGQDRFGMSSRLENGEVYVSYPQTMFVWRRD